MDTHVHIFTHMNEKAHMNELRSHMYTYEWVMAHVWMTCTSEFCWGAPRGAPMTHSYEWVYVIDTYAVTHLCGWMSLTHMPWLIHMGTHVAMTHYDIQKYNNESWPHMNGSWRTCEWHVQMSCVGVPLEGRPWLILWVAVCHWIRDSFDSFIWVHMWPWLIMILRNKIMSHGHICTHMNQSRHMCEWHIWMCHVWHTNECVISRIRMSHISHP